MHVLPFSLQLKTFQIPNPPPRASKLILLILHLAIATATESASHFNRDYTGFSGIIWHEIQRLGVGGSHIKRCKSSPVLEILNPISQLLLSDIKIPSSPSFFPLPSSCLWLTLLPPSRHLLHPPPSVLPHVSSSSLLLPACHVSVCIPDELLAPPA